MDAEVHQRVIDALRYSESTTGRTVIGAAFLIYALFGAVRVIRNYASYGRVPLNNKAGIGPKMLCSINTSITLFIIVLGLDAFIKLVVLMDAGGPYAITYKPLVLILSAGTVFLVVSSYFTMYLHSIEREYKTPLFSRIKKLHSYYSERGMNELELAVAPLVSVALAYSKDLLLAYGAA